MFVPLKGHCHTNTSTFFPATVKHKACLRSCHRKRPISGEQVAFLFSKTIPMACRTVSCLWGSFHHLKHLAALQHAAAAGLEPIVPLLSWATVLSHSSNICLLEKKKIPSSFTSWCNTPNSMYCSAATEIIHEIIFNCTILAHITCLFSITYSFGLWIPWCVISNTVPAVPNQETLSIPDVIAAKCSLAALLCRFPSETRIHFISRGKPGLSG